MRFQQVFNQTTQRPSFCHPWFCRLFFVFSSFRVDQSLCCESVVSILKRFPHQTRELQKNTHGLKPHGLVVDPPSCYTELLLTQWLANKTELWKDLRTSDLSVSMTGFVPRPKGKGQTTRWDRDGGTAVMYGREIFFKEMGFAMKSSAWLQTVFLFFFFSQLLGDEDFRLGDWLACGLKS